MLNVATTLAPNRAAMRAHLEFLFADALDGRIELAWRDAGTGKLSSAQSFPLFQLDEIADRAVEINAIEGQNVYFGAALRQADTAPFGRCADKDFLALSAFYVDIDDDCTAQAAEIYRARSCPPSGVVITGRHPHKRAQLFWRLNAPLADAERCRAQNAALAKALGGDPTVANPGRVLRLAGSIAWPVKDGRVGELTEFLEYLDRDRYSPEQIALAFPLKQSALPVQDNIAAYQRTDTPGLLIGTSSSVDVDRCLLRIRAGDHWHDNLTRVVAHWVSCDRSDAEIFADCMALTLAGYTHEDTRREVAAMIRGARTKWNRPDPAHATGVNPDRFHFVSFSNLKPGVERSYIVKPLIPRTGLVVVWGPPKCGKSFWTFDLAVHIALGRNYRDHCVTQGTVVYAALEGASGYGARAEALRRHYGLGDEEVPLVLLPTALDLAADSKALVGAIKGLAGEVPKVIVVDTLNRSLAGSESSDEDMAAYLRGADVLREAFGAVVVIVHHCGIDDRRPRGHTSLTGACDAQLSVRRGPGDNDFTVTVDRMKDGPEGEVLVSRLKVVDVGTDEDGEPITSCVVEPVEGQTTARQVPTRKLSDRQRLAVDALRTLVATEGQPVPVTFGLPAGVSAVSVTAWRDDLYRRGALDADAKNPRTNFSRLKDSLQARQITAERDGLIWLV